MIRRCNAWSASESWISPICSVFTGEALGFTWLGGSVWEVLGCRLAPAPKTSKLLHVCSVQTGCRNGMLKHEQARGKMLR